VRRNPGFMATLAACAAVLLCPFCMVTCINAQREVPVLPAATTSIEGNPLVFSIDGSIKIVVLDFFTSWCVPCAVEARALETVYRQRVGSDVAIVGVDVREDRLKAKSFATAQGITFPVILDDGQVQKQYKAYSFPILVIVNLRTGKSERLEGWKSNLSRQIAFAVKDVR
jgi:thiol-disulfide isomerase/thioredoxin